MLKHSLTVFGILLAGSASAHSTLKQKLATVGTTSKLVMRVPHGCDGEASHTVRIALPEGFYAAKPMPKPGWDLEVVTGAYETPYNNHGTEMTEGVREIIWSNGNLPDEFYDEFVFRGAVGPNVDAGSVMFFPTVQECANGVADWTDTSGSHDVPNPAPNLTVVAAEGDMDHDHGAHDAHADASMAGPIEVTGGFSRATLPNAPVGGGFMTITNTGTEDDTLIAATSPVSGITEIHEMKMDGDVMKMRELENGLTIPAGETVELKPGGFHIMFMDLNTPLEEGETVNVTLTFEKAGDVDIPLAIGAINADGGHDHHGGGHSHSH
ncbi:copper chaperone PCu(A)C [Amaricoccus tamworthensis]|uniref:copper chaperone PCu(A)C n=1 Tax=Amaricoccus tamworthensis TaxID=57002 RepID=UPI003C7D83A6